MKGGCGREGAVRAGRDFQVQIEKIKKRKVRQPGRGKSWEVHFLVMPLGNIEAIGGEELRRPPLKARIAGW